MFWERDTLFTQERPKMSILFLNNFLTTDCPERLRSNRKLNHGFSGKRGWNYGVGDQTSGQDFPERGIRKGGIIPPLLLLPVRFLAFQPFPGRRSLGEGGNALTSHAGPPC